MRTWLSDNSHGTAETDDRVRVTYAQPKKSFSLRFRGLTPKLLVHIQAYQAQGYRIILNLTGGFKSINGYLQTVGTFCADEQFYLFEGSTAVMVIPRLPICLDRLSTFKDHLLTYRRLALRLHVDLNHVAALPETMLVRLGSDVALSAYGVSYYERKLVPSCMKRKFFHHQAYVLAIAQTFVKASMVCQLNACASLMSVWMISANTSKQARKCLNQQPLRRWQVHPSRG